MSRSLNNTEVPELRFSGFDEDWNELKFNKLIQLISGQHLSPHEYSLDSGEIPYFTGPSDFTNDVSKITKWTKYSEKSAQKSDILITVKGNGVGEMLFLHLPCVAMGRQLMAIRPIAVVGQILYQKLFTYKQQFQALASGNVIPGLSRPDILTTKIYLPGLKEQEKIASFLGAVDTRLTQLRRKHELLQTYKRGVMQKLFSQQIRFKCDDGKPFPDWEKKKFSQVFERITRKNKENNLNTLTISAQHGLINQRDFFNKSVSADDLTGYYLLKRGDFAYNKSYSNGYPMGATKRLKLYEKGVVSTLYICFSSENEVEAQFYEKYFEGGFLNHELSKIAQEGARNHGLLNMSVVEFFRDITLDYPSIKEQEKIANFLTALDQKIEAIAQQIELTEQYKKGLLQKMFL